MMYSLVLSTSPWKRMTTGIIKTANHYRFTPLLELLMGFRDKYHLKTLSFDTQLPDHHICVRHDSRPSLSSVNAFYNKRMLVSEKALVSNWIENKTSFDASSAEKYLESAEMKYLKRILKKRIFTRHSYSLDIFHFSYSNSLSNQHIRDRK